VEPLRRSWCLFEILQSIGLRDERPNFKGFVFCTSSGVLNYGAQAYDVAMSIAKEVSTIRVQDAKASVRADKEMIDALVMDYPGGFERVNQFLGENIKEALHSIRESFEKDFNSLNTVLGARPAAVLAVERKRQFVTLESQQPQRPSIMIAAAAMSLADSRVDSEDHEEVDLEKQTP